jgi:NitT/TauT family transport system ATP-binding protein
MTASGALPFVANTPRQTVIAFESVSHAFGDASSGNVVPVVSDVNLTIEEGEFVSLIGPSGCGKSTLLGMAAGFLEPAHGRVSLFGQEPKGMRKEIGMVFQSFSLLPWRTVLDNVALGLEFRGIPKQQRLAQARDLIATVGLKGFEERYPRQLSGGMNQRVTVARALALNPKILLLDEPFGALDEQTRILIGEELYRLCLKFKPTSVLVTHSIAEAVRLSTRIVVMGARPTSVKKIVNVNNDSRHGAAAAAIEEEVWSLLKDEAKRAMLGQAS